MAEAFLYGSGGGNPLNFTLVGGTSQPSGPKANTVWVNTSTAITSWVFSAVQPTSPTAGMVWIAIGPYAGAPFSVLKKQQIMVHPIYAKQYISGAWVEKTAKTYQNGAWVNWIVYLYRQNDFCAGVTGGYSVEALNLLGATSAHEPEIVNGVDGMWIKQGHLGTDGKHWGGCAFTKNSINLSSFKKLTCVVAQKVTASGSSDKVQMIVYNGSSIVSSVSITGAGTFNIDVSSLTGSYRLGFCINANNSKTTGNQILVTEITLNP